MCFDEVSSCCKLNLQRGPNCGVQILIDCYNVLLSLCQSHPLSLSLSTPTSPIGSVTSKQH